MLVRQDDSPLSGGCTCLSHTTAVFLAYQECTEDVRVLQKFIAATYKGVASFWLVCANAVVDRPSVTSYLDIV